MRSSPLNVARRAFSGLIRGTVHTAHDDTRIQNLDVRLLNNELIARIERFQQYGFSSVPTSPDDKGHAAEVAVAFLSGNQSHPIVIATDDRRYRPKDGEAGQVGLWHYKGQALNLTTSGFSYNAGAEKKPFEVIHRVVGRAGLEPATRPL